MIGKFTSTLIFTTYLGLLVEPNIFNYQKLLEVNRKAASINACYSMSRLPTLVDFINAHAVSGIRGSHMTGFLMNSMYSS